MTDIHTQSYNDMVQEVLGNTQTTKSYKIRTLYAFGVKKADIARLLEIRYQHVRNVLLQPLKKAQ